jgi:hypothetical protein
VPRVFVEDPRFQSLKDSDAAAVVLLRFLDIFESLVKDFAQETERNAFDLGVNLESPCDGSVETVDRIIHEVLIVIFTL